MQTGNIIQLAMEAELAALEQYLRLASEVKEVGAKEMFIHLAKDELLHFRTLSTMQAGQKDRPTLTSPAWDRLMEKVSTMGTTKISGKDQIDAVELALAEEEKAEQIYRNEAGGSSDQAMKDTWLGLASMERGHAAILRAQLKELRRSGFWLDLLPAIQTMGSEVILPPQG